MLCDDCVERIRKDSLSNFRKDHPKAIDPELWVENEGVIFKREGDTAVPEDILYIPMEIRYHEKNRKGNVKSKKYKVNVIASYCPFCGKKLTKEE